jgi:hypothetical protein
MFRGHALFKGYVKDELTIDEYYIQYMYTIPSQDKPALAAVRRLLVAD